jgi:hypothetical protein
MHSNSIPMQYEHAKSHRETVSTDAPDAIYAPFGTSPRSQPTGLS